MMQKMILASLLAAPLVIGASAQAHVSLEQKTAVAGSYQKLTLRVGHGCEGSATTALTITLPEGLKGAKTMPKPGWTVAPAGGARDVSWKGGPLPDEQFDEFNLLVKLPDAPGKQVFRVLQQCEKGRADWSELPGTAGKFPAPVLEIVPADPATAGPAPAAHHH